MNIQTINYQPFKTIKMKKSNNINQGLYEIVRTITGEVIGYKLRYSVPVDWAKQLKARCHVESVFLYVHGNRATYIREYCLDYFESMRKQIAWIKCDVAMFKAAIAIEEAKIAAEIYGRMVGYNPNEQIQQPVEEPLKADSSIFNNN